MHPKTLIRAIIIILLVGSIAGYAYFKTVPFVRGPQLTMTTPHNGATVSTPFLSVEGKARHIAFLRINGRQIYTNASGVFEEQLLLLPGYNIITVTARDRFGRRTTERVEVVYQADKGTVEMPDSRSYSQAPSPAPHEKSSS